MGSLVARHSACLYPRVAFLNGFCYMIKRPVIEALGYFDETNFGRGYGEENDYSLRAGKAGWQLAIADDTYVYHAHSRSYSDERRKELWKHATIALREKHGSQIINDGVEVCRFDRLLEGIRARSQVMVSRWQLIENGKDRWAGKRVLFVLPISEACGGGNVVLTEAQAMRQMGVDAQVVNLTRNKDGFDQGYPNNTIPINYVNETRCISELQRHYDVVIATWNASVYWLASSTCSAKPPVRGYYVQDFEPHFFPEGSAPFATAWNSYTCCADLVRITKTEWTRVTLRENVGVDCTLVGPSVNVDLFRPRKRHLPEWPARPLRVAAMIRPSTPYRAPILTLEVLGDLHRIHGEAIEITIFGCSAEDLLSTISSDLIHSGYRNAGVLTQEQMASLLNEIDIFVDFSSHQAMGLTAMEAMCCGAAVIVPQKGGALSFVSHEKNGIIVDTSLPEACLAALDQLVLDHGLRAQLQRQAIFDICRFFPENAAYNILSEMFRGSPRGQ